MVARAKPKASRAQVLIEVARQIVRESGDFDLPMRELAARAQVSLRTPYEMFGSKAGVIRAILKSDQEIYRRRLRENLNRSDAFGDLFNSLKIGVEFYSENQSFYRALFRATQAYSGGGEAEPGRENPDRFEGLCRRAIAEGLLDPEVSAHALAESLLDIFAANVRSWASSTYDVRLVEPRIGFGWSALLAGLATPAQVGRLRGLVASYQHRLSALEAPS